MSKRFARTYYEMREVVDKFFHGALLFVIAVFLLDLALRSNGL